MGRGFLRGASDRQHKVEAHSGVCAGNPRFDAALARFVLKNFEKKCASGLLGPIVLFNNCFAMLP